MIAREISSIENDYRLLCHDMKLKLGVYSRFTSANRNFIVERQFENLFMKFEELIETVFVSYSMGFQPVSGAHMTRSVILTSEQDVLDLYSGGKEYPDWTRWETLIKLSKYFFTPSPFDNLVGYIVQLNELKTVRNALAHISGTAYVKYQTLVRSKIGFFPTGGLSVAEFLMTPIATNPSQVYFQEYIDYTLTALRLIS